MPNKILSFGNNISSIASSHKHRLLPPLLRLLLSLLPPLLRLLLSLLPPLLLRLPLLLLLRLPLLQLLLLLWLPLLQLLLLRPPQRLLLLTPCINFAVNAAGREFRKHSFASIAANRSKRIFCFIKISI
jgi:hypothetical protein